MLLVLLVVYYLMKKPPDFHTLNSLYVEQNLTAVEIAPRIGYSRSRTFALLRAAGITANKRVVTRKDTDFTPRSLPERPHREPTAYHKLPDAEWLRARYWTDNQNVTDIAKEFGVNPSAVSYALKRYGIPIKPRWLAHQDRPRGKKGDWTLKLRRIVLDRDGHHCRFPDCGATDALEVHHIVPLRLGGLTAPDNGITLCATCHTKRIGWCEVNWIDHLRALRG